jgi:hypothetical protein
MPLYVIVHFPSYSGLPFFENLPRTWVPVPQACIQHKDRRSLCRTGTPLKISWAMTIHKSQGLTAAEGCIVDLRVRSKRNPVALSGLAFVAWTRTESFDRLAFKSLPRLLHFFECRQHKDFKLRENFELEASKKHDLYLSKVYGLTPMQEVEQHYAHTEQMKCRPLLDEEKTEIKVALLRQGMQSLSPDLEHWIAESEGASNFATLADIARSFKGRRATCTSEGIKSVKLAKTKKKFDVLLDLYQPLLRNMGFEAAVVAKALSTGCLDLNKLIDQCLPDSAPDANDSIEGGDQFLYESYRAIGLETDCADNNQVEKHKRLAKRRACKKKTFSTLMPTDYVFSSYLARAVALHPEKNWKVWDFGAAADRSINACFWLSIVAGMSRCERSHGTFDCDTETLLSDIQMLGEINLEDMIQEHRPLYGDDSLGKLAKRLRHLVCGQSGFMLQPSQVRKWAPAFAYLQQQHEFGASFSDYTAWVNRVASTEYADELVLAATAEMLQLDLVVIPYTPPGSASQWAIWNSQSTERDQFSPHRILLGNDDVHYVLVF